MTRVKNASHCCSLLDVRWMSGAQIDMEYINTIELVQLKRMNILQEGNDKVYL